MGPGDVWQHCTKLEHSVNVSDKGRAVKTRWSANPDYIIRIISNRNNYDVVPAYNRACCKNFISLNLGRMNRPQKMRHFSVKFHFFNREELQPRTPDVSFGDRRLIDMWPVSTRRRLYPGGGEQRGDRHHNATQTVGVVRRLKSASCRISYLLAKLALYLHKCNLEKSSASLLCIFLPFKALTD